MKVILMTVTLLFSSFSSIVLADDENDGIECIILTDWDYEYYLLDDNADEGWTNISNIATSVIHKYVVEFHPPFVNGSTPHLVTSTIDHQRDDESLASSFNSNIVIAGGVIDIILPEEPLFRDEIDISIETLEATCSRSIIVTNWHQPISDHEITTNRTWSNSISSFEENSSNNLFFEGRGWQQRTGQTLISNELGTGNFELDGFEEIDIELNLDKVWLNQTYFDEELVAQEFEMKGDGSLFTIQNGLEISVNVTDASYNRTLLQETFTEHLIIDGNGFVEIFDNSDNQTLFLNGTISTFYFESLDSDGARDYQQINLAASATSFIEFADGEIELELEEFRFNDLWVYGIQEEQLFKYTGNANFDFVVEDEQPYIYANGTVDNLHFEERNGLIIVDTIRLDGTYSGDASGSFGLIRQIEDTVSQVNNSGINFEVNKIQNEVWFNVSSISNFPIDQELTAEHNLTYEYTVPQSTWANPTIRYQYIEDNGSTSNEYPEDSPIPIEPERPQANSMDYAPITKETGVSPEILFSGDRLVISNNMDFILTVLVKDSRQVIIDGHDVKVIDWIGNYGENTQASGSIINEGLLAGLFFQINRSVSLVEDIQTDFSENQILVKITSPSIITAEENTPPSLESIQFREGVLYAEGGIAHLEITVLDIDNDVKSVSIDLSEFGLGNIQLSDKGMFGDSVIDDNIWTSLISAEGIEFGNKTVDLEITDIWETVVLNTNMEILNPAPTFTSIVFTPSVVKRGDLVEVSVIADDAHGVASISLELMSAGGESIDLSFIDSEWIGQFLVPNTIAPGERLVPVRLTDNYDSSRLTTQSQFDGIIVESLLIIENEAPKVVNYNISKDGEFSNIIQVPIDGNPIAQILEITIQDPDGISSVQVKMGRLAPIGQSNDWILMKDDGLGVDRISGDGIYSLEVFARSSLPNGELEILVRGTDIYLSSTSADDQRLIIDLDKVDSNSGSENWIIENSSLLIAVGLVFLLVLSAVGVLLVFRNSEFE
tara:strand:- start:42 stop:3056 length:3015 start_codon:yes stop_codon:yes gene_type:complete